MALALVALRVDAADPLGLARFWAEALRWEVGDETDGGVSLVPTDGTRFRMDFLPVADTEGSARTGAPRPDDHVARRPAGLRRPVVELGGRHIDIGQKPEEGHVVLADPEGNELCLIGRATSSSRAAARLGAISCDGTREVGYFWSAALGWPLVWDQDEETAIQAPDGTGPKITWGGPPLNPKLGRNRFHLELAPLDGADQRSRGRPPRLARCDPGRRPTRTTATGSPCAIPTATSSPSGSADAASRSDRERAQEHLGSHRHEPHREQSTQAASVAGRARKPTRPDRRAARPGRRAAARRPAP